MNRRQRREAAKGSRSTAPDSDPSLDVPLARPPPPSPRKSKTLYEIAAEKQAELSQHGQPFPPTSSSSSPGLVTRELLLRPNGTLSDHPPLTTSPLTYTSTSTYPVSSSASETSNTQSSSSEHPILSTLFNSLTLSIIHFTLSFLSAHQYAQSIPYPLLVAQSLLLALPTLTFLIHLVHGHIIHIPHLFVPPPLRQSSQKSRPPPRALQTLFLLAANVSGCRLIALTNDAPYYAVMKRAPAIGVLWVWSVLEMGLAGAVGGVVGPAVYAWWWGYGIW